MAERNVSNNKDTEFANTVLALSLLSLTGSGDDDDDDDPSVYV